MAQLARVQIVNPAKKRTKKRHKPSGVGMAAKKRRSRARKRASSSKKKTIRRKRRHVAAAASAPKRRRKGVRVRKASRAKKARHNKRAATAVTRLAVSNPKKRRKSGKRRHKRNPGIPPYAMAALAALAGVGAYVLGNVASYRLTQEIDPTMVSVIRNRRIAGALLALGGVAVAALAKAPLLGAGIAAGGLVTAMGTEAAVELSKLVAPQSEAPPMAGIEAIDQLGMGAVVPADSIGALLAFH